jgi:hypothetical protein
MARAVFPGMLIATGRPPDKVADDVLHEIVAHLQFCRVCGDPYLRSRKLKRTCGKPPCHSTLTKAMAMNTLRLSRFKKKFNTQVRHAIRSSHRARSGKVSKLKPIDILGRWIAGDARVHQLLDVLAEEHPPVMKLLTRATRYLNRNKTTRLR